MYKKELINELASKLQITKKEADRIIDAYHEVLTEALVKGDSVNIMGFGNFVVKRRNARVGVNPQTGQKIEIAAHDTPHFKASKKLKEKINRK